MRLSTLDATVYWMTGIVLKLIKSLHPSPRNKFSPTLIQMNITRLYDMWMGQKKRDVMCTIFSMWLLICVLLQARVITCSAQMSNNDLVGPMVSFYSALRQNCSRCICQTCTVKQHQRWARLPYKLYVRVHHFHCADLNIIHLSASLCPGNTCRSHVDDPTHWAAYGRYWPRVHAIHVSQEEQFAVVK